jgi:hypothetical protein
MWLARTLSPCLELVRILLVEVVDLRRRNGRLRADLGLEHLRHPEVVAGVSAKLLERHVALGEHLLECLVRRKLLADLRDARLEVGVGDDNLARLGFLDKQVIADQLIQNAAEHHVALLRGDLLSGIRLERHHRLVELSFADRFAVDPCDHLGNLRGHWLRGLTLSRRCGKFAKCRRSGRGQCGLWGGVGGRSWRALRAGAECKYSDERNNSNHGNSSVEVSYQPTTADRTGWPTPGFRGQFPLIRELVGTVRRGGRRAEVRS